MNSTPRVLVEMGCLSGSIDHGALAIIHNDRCLMNIELNIVFTFHGAAPL